MHRVEASLEVAEAKLMDAKRVLAELYARGAITIYQRRLVGELGAQVEQLRRQRREQAELPLAA